MKKQLVISLVSLGILQGACAKQGPGDENMTATEESIIARNEQRIESLENQLSSLNAQIEQMNNRVYEVRTKTGQKTSMTVVPVNDATPQNIGASNSAFQASQLGPSTVKSAPVQSKPQGRVINPATKPSPMPKTQPLPAQAKIQPSPGAATTMGPAGSVGTPEATAGPSGQLSASPADNLSLPPAELPVTPAPTHQNGAQGNAGNGGATAQTSYRANAQANAVPPVPVPVLPDSGLSLPPENVADAQSAQTQNPVAAAASAQAQPAAPAHPVALPRGEANAYNAALKAVRSGHTNQGIQMFREFLQQYPRGKYAANADYWIGECLYQQGKYSDALSQFNTVNSSFPTHHKNADALLKAGMSLSKLGDKAAASEKYRAILTQFPSSDAAKKVRAMGIK